MRLGEVLDVGRVDPRLVGRLVERCRTEVVDLPQGVDDPGVIGI